MRSPTVLDHEWGRIEVEGLHGESIAFGDVKLYPGGARKWDWNETNTHHRPGIQLADVEELLDAGAQVIVLSQGHLERLLVPEETIRWLEAQGVEVYVLPTPAAIEKYNELVPTAKVGALLHSTC